MSLEINRNKPSTPLVCSLEKQGLYLSKKRTLFCPQGYMDLSSRNVMFALEKIFIINKIFNSFASKETSISFVGNTEWTLGVCV